MDRNKDADRLPSRNTPWKSACREKESVCSRNIGTLYENKPRSIYNNAYRDEDRWVKITILIDREPQVDVSELWVRNFSGTLKNRKSWWRSPEQWAHCDAVVSASFIPPRRTHAQMHYRCIRLLHNVWLWGELQAMNHAPPRTLYIHQRMEGCSSMAGPLNTDPVASRDRNLKHRAV